MFPVKPLQDMCPQNGFVVVVKVFCLLFIVKRYDMENSQ